MQKIFLIGNLTNDPETRTTQSGVSVCSFNIAVNRRFPGSDGQKQTDFFRINAWRQLGDNCQRFLAKGRKVAVVGELQPRTYEDKNGTTRVSLDVTADEVEFLTPKNSQGDSAKSDYSVPEVNALPDVSDDELPWNS